MESFSFCNKITSWSAPNHSQQPCTSEGFDRFCWAAARACWARPFDG
ncbi:hypothetical protein SynBOUM118_01703 [Synechococcus sp. BOUM118]|nr:hypothetical protein SynBOUM118_01703 [Synechococcus sp. BOUM118]QNJ17242.1 hypothetical protein SynA1840_01704 [Synechococcus sp. A18-40]